MKKRVVLTAIAVACCGFIGGFVSLYFIAEHVAAPKPAQDSQSNETPQQTVEEQPIKLSLPGADPIVAMLDDYTSPSSQWVVVSKDHPLTKQQYYPTDLKQITVAKTLSERTTEERSLRVIVMSDLADLFDAAAAAGHNLMIGSAFRSYATQKSLYSYYVSTSGEAAANTFSAKPGQSEHQTGLAFDIRLTSGQCYLDTCFGTLPSGKWLAEHAPTYGFIIRYPADKTDITKYQYEPWHLRYVGRPLALALKQSGLTLDEAYPYLQDVRDTLIAAKKITVKQ